MIYIAAALFAGAVVWYVHHASEVAYTRGLLLALIAVKREIEAGKTTEQIHEVISRNIGDI